ncbi:MAG: putative bifunctional diguanylate cyclase/phosphodiesterase [Pseudomonadota bacterium]
MHQAKKAGNRYAFYAADRDEASPQRLALVTELRQAIELDQLTLHYQPKVDLRSGRACGVEALVRWKHPERGMMPPDSFIPLAEHTGLIRPLTEWVIMAALRQAAAWRRTGMELPIAVNLSAHSLRDREFLGRLERMFIDWEASADWLEFEITESAIMDDPEHALDILRRLHELGIALFIDDFGTGYSSLSYLQRLPVDALKIDRSFVKDLLEDKDSASIVRSTITLAHDLGIGVVAEGIETAAVRDRLAELACDQAQGYFFGKPMPAEEFAVWAALPVRID